jgi:uncharacterized protein (DUF2249 family)
MPPRNQFKRLDVRPILERGDMPLPVVLEAAAALGPGEGLLVITPFLPSPLIKVLQGEGFQSRMDRGADGLCEVYFWK